MYDVEQRLRSALHEAAPEGRSVPFDPIARRAEVRRNVKTATAAGVSALAVAAIAVTATTLGPSVTPGPPVAGRSTQPTQPTQPTQSARQQTSGCVRGLDPDTVAVDWVDFLRLYGQEYVAKQGTVRPDQVGAVVGTVRCTFSVTLPGPRHVPTDGDAGFLPVGTEIHALKGYPPTERLVAKMPGRAWTVYTRFQR